MTTITIEDAQAKLPELIGGSARGEELVITQAGQVVARLVGGEEGPPEAPAASASEGTTRSWPSKAGSGKTEGFWMAPDFDEPAAPSKPAPREPGSAKDKILWMSSDFDEPLEEFRESME